MHITVPLLALLSTSAHAVSQYGQWRIIVTKSTAANGWSSQTVAANFSSPAYPTGIISTCTDVTNPAATPAESKGCDNEAFAYEYDSQTIKVQQVLELPTPQTVFGNGELTLSVSGPVGRTFRGEATIDVTSAIA